MMRVHAARNTEKNTVEFQQFSAPVCSYILLTQSTQPPQFREKSMFRYIGCDLMG